MLASFTKHAPVIVAGCFFLFVLGRGLAFHARIVFPHAEAQLMPHELSLGVVAPGQTVERSVQIANLGKERLLITRIQPSCHCVIADPASRVIPPGQSISIPVTFKAMTAGDKDERIIFETNDPAHSIQILTVRADVDAQRTASLASPEAMR